MSKITLDQVLRYSDSSICAEQIMTLIDQREAELLKEQWHHPACRKMMYDIKSSPCTCESEYKRQIEDWSRKKAEFQELVDGVGHLLERWNTPGELNITGLRKAYRKLCPPPDPHKELADRLNQATSRMIEGCHLQPNELREIAAEIEKLGEKD